MKHYNQITPPLYHAENVDVPVVLFWGDMGKKLPEKA